MRVRRLRALIVVILLGAAAMRLGLLARPFDNDSGLYLYIGKVVASGGMLYRDAYDTKPPGVAILGSMCWRIFGSWWGGYVLLQIGMAMGAAVMLGRSLARHTGEGARWPTTLFALVYLNFGPVVVGGFQLETILACLAIVAACSGMAAMTRRSPWFAFWCGLAGGSAATIKPTGLAVMGALAVVWLVRWRGEERRRWMTLAAAALAGSLLPIAGVLAWTVHQGILDQMPELVRQVRLYGSQTPLQAADWVVLPAVIVGLGFPFFVRGWVFRRELTSPQSQAEPSHVLLLVFGIAWLGLEASGIFLQKRMYGYHFLVLAPAAAWLYGLMVQRRRVVGLAAGLLPILALSLLWSARGLGGDGAGLAASAGQLVSDCAYRSG